MITKIPESATVIPIVTHPTQVFSGASASVLVALNDFATERTDLTVTYLKGRVDSANRQLITTLLPIHGPKSAHISAGHKSTSFDVTTEMVTEKTTVVILVGTPSGDFNIGTLTILPGP